MRVTDEGQVTIPPAIREAAGLRPGTEVEFRLDPDGGVRLVRGAEAAAHIDQVLARMWGSATTGLTTDEIMEMTRGPFDDVRADERAGG